VIIALSGATQGGRPGAPKMPAARVKVLLADDHPIYREGLARAIRERPELKLVAEAENGRMALDLIRDHKPDVAVLDVRMPDLDGPQVMRALRREGLEVEVIFLSAGTDGGTSYGVVADGARGYLSKKAGRQEICEAISRVARGETVLAAEVQSGLASEIGRRQAITEGPDLTAREREILRLVADGLSAPDIGREIHLSPTTVKGHLHTLYDKLGVSDRAAAVAEAMRRGLLE
jgi:two-component system, NarL family, nitrate/nitrite response regulator NarL